MRSAMSMGYSRRRGRPSIRLSAQDQAARFARGFGRFTYAIWPLLLFAAVYTCMCIGLWRHAEAQTRSFKVRAAGVEIVVPKWLQHRHEDVQRIRMLASSLEGRSLLEKDLPSRLAAAYRQSPWVRRVRSVRRKFPDRVVVDLEIRKPFASVRIGTNGGFFQVDREGIRLPIVEQPKPPEKLPVILMPETDSPEPGLPFDDRAPGDAVEVLETLQRFMQVIPPSDALKVVGIKAGPRSRLGRDRVRELTIYCRSREGKLTRVDWGYHFRDMEVPPDGLLATADKLELLENYLAAIAQSGRSVESINVSAKLDPAQAIRH
jgi:hypothetical protein